MDSFNYENQLSHIESGQEMDEFMYISKELRKGGRCSLLVR